MPIQLHDDQPLELVFGTRDGDRIRFDVLGLTNRNAKKDWDRAQLNVEIHIHLGTFRGYRSLVMFSDDFHRFRAALKRLTSGEAAVAVLETGDFLSVDVTADGSSYNVWMQLDALEQDGDLVLLDDGAENWEWRLAMDRSSLTALMDASVRVSE